MCGWRHVLSAGTTKVLCNRVCGIMTRNLAPLQSEEAKDKEEEQLWDEQSLHSVLNWQTTLFSSCSCWVCDFPPGIYRLKFLNFLHHERTGIQFKCRVLRWLTSYHHRHVSYDVGDGPWVESRIIWRRRRRLYGDLRVPSSTLSVRGFRIEKHTLWRYLDVDTGRMSLKTRNVRWRGVCGLGWDVEPTSEALV